MAERSVRRGIEPATKELVTAARDALARVASDAARKF
jgi:hypothetical protein